MTLNHLNLTVPDPLETSAFLAKYFALQPAGGNAGIQMLRDDAGMVLTLIKARREDLDAAEAVAPESAASRAPGVKYPSSFHVGFILPTADAVDEVHRRLRADGVTADPPSVQHGAWTFYFKAPGGFTIEVMG